MALADMKGGPPPLTRERVGQLLADLDLGWITTLDATRIKRIYQFKEFHTMWDFADRVGQITKNKGHHVVLHIGWGRCTVEIWTSQINGLIETDFSLAAKYDQTYAQMATS